MLSYMSKSLSFPRLGNASPQLFDTKQIDKQFSNLKLENKHLKKLAVESNVTWAKCANVPILLD
jgi:hypothetical protein